MCKFREISGNFGKFRGFREIRFYPLCLNPFPGAATAHKRVSQGHFWPFLGIFGKILGFSGKFGKNSGKFGKFESQICKNIRVSRVFWAFFSCFLAKNCRLNFKNIRGSRGVRGSDLDLFPTPKFRDFSSNFHDTKKFFGDDNFFLLTTLFWSTAPKFGRPRFL